MAAARHSGHSRGRGEILGDVPPRVRIAPMQGSEFIRKWGPGGPSYSLTERYCFERDGHRLASAPRLVFDSSLSPQAN